MFLNNKWLIVANWKNHPNSPIDAQKFFSAAKRIALTLKRTEVVIAPPLPYLALLAKKIPPKKIFLGAQTLSPEEGGSWTGAVPASMIFEIGARYVLVGHSEERQLGLSDNEITKRLASALKAGLRPILCVGENKRDGDGAFLSFLETQIKTALEHLPKRYLADLIIAYEPVWAIGKTEREAMNPRDLHEMVIFIRKTILSLDATAPRTPILYGGSVGAHNAASFLAFGEADGLLVGRGSLETISFKELLGVVDAVRR
jgi:triosephosphate isomerase